MRFLAMLPGVHTIDGLTLTDLDTGESISLRYSHPLMPVKLSYLLMLFLDLLWISP